MSRLDLEYDAGGRHDLEDVERIPGSYRNDPWVWVGVCCCGEPTPARRSRGDARRAHELHQDDELGRRPL